MRLRYVFSLLLAILLAPFFAFWAWSAIEAARLDRVFDALEARREPLDVAEFERKPATDEQRQASHLYAEAGKLVDDVSLNAFTALGKTIEHVCDPAAEDTQADFLTLEDVEHRYARALELLDRAAELDASGWDERDKPATFSPAVMRPEQLASVNAVRTARRACGDEREQAARALLSTLRLRRMPPWPNTLRRMHTAHGLQLVLTRSRPEPSMLEALQREFEREADDHEIERQMLFSRARWLADTHPGLFSDPPPDFAARKLTPFTALAMRLSRPARDHATVRELREFDEVIEAAKAPWPQKLDEAARLARKYPRPRSRGLGVTNIASLFALHVANSQMQFHVPSIAESLARTRASIGALAVARWRADHGGALPASLHDLVPSYVSAPLMDPYTGGELKYVIGRPERPAPQAPERPAPQTPERPAARGPERPAPDGYKVYSVGANRKDDGGRWEQSSDLQWARRGEPFDIGIAVTASPKLP